MNCNKNLYLISKILFLGVILFFSSVAFAENIDVNDAGNDYAQLEGPNENSSINFDCDDCNVHVADDQITGYAWGENIGWIALHPSSTYYVQNDGEGELSGYAWGENTGWINFSPTNSGVSVNPSNGYFDGYAWSQNHGWINFNCPGALNTCVQTSWTPGLYGGGGGDPGGGGPNGGGDFPECKDGIDNDGDGFFDFGFDPGCDSSLDDSELDDIPGVCLLGGSPNLDIEEDNLVINVGGNIFSNLTINLSDDNTTVQFLKQSLEVSNPENFDTNQIGIFILTIQITDKDGCVDFDILKILIQEEEGGDDDEVIFGCTDEEALNYDPSSTVDDGSCLYDVDTDDDDSDDNGPGGGPGYNPTGGGDTGGGILGCTDNGAINYNSTAVYDNNTCLYEVGLGDNPGGGDDPTGGILTTTAITLGGGAIAALVAAQVLVHPVNFLQILLSPLRFFNSFLIFFGFRKRRKPWGTVYDSVTKQPLDPVTIALIRKNGEQVSTAITDMDGRYGFATEPGVYKMSAGKSDYVFPSKNMEGKEKDVIYDNLYFGGNFEVKNEDEAIENDIPMDPVGVNWNEIAKREMKTMHFYSKRVFFLRQISNGMFYAGLIISFIGLVLYPSILNIIVLSVYAFVFIVRLLGFKLRTYGTVENRDGKPSSFSILKVFSERLDRHVRSVVVNERGFYYCLVPKGRYYVTIEEKISEEEYREVFKSESFNERDGHISRRFKI